MIRTEKIHANSIKSITEEKKFIDWMKDSEIAYGPLLALDEFDLMTIIAQGLLKADTKEFENIFLNAPESPERLKGIKEFRNKLGIKTDSLFTDSKGNIQNGKSVLNRKPKSKADKIIDSLKTLDELNLGAILADEEAIMSIVNGKIDKLWNALYNKDITVDEIASQINKSNKSLRFFSEIIERFINEFYSVGNYNPPAGYKHWSPNIMQKLYVKRLAERKYYANWSGMGSGKTISAIIASREIDARLTVIAVINGTDEQWCEEILKAYPDSVVYNGYKIKDYDKINFDYSKHNYVIIPYSRFSIKADSIKIENIAKKKIDFLICDEVHTVKSSDAKTESIRRENIKRLVKVSELNNPNIYRTVMTGTPVINNLEEPKSLLCVLLNDELSDVQTKRNMQNSVKLYQLLTLHGVRVVPEYKESLRILDGSNTQQLWIDYSDETESFSKLETANDVYKFTLEGKLKAVSRYIVPGVTLFSYFTTGIINKICNHITKMGFTYSLYTGDNEKERKSQLEKFLKGETDILIASSPVSTGINGLQHRCNRLIPITLPYTNAMWEQLICRFYRQGMKRNVEVIIPQTYLNVGGEIWSWDRSAYNLIKAKKTLADWILDGIVTTKSSVNNLWKESRNSLVGLKDRINSNIVVREKEELQVADINPEDIKPRNFSNVTMMNEKGHHWSSDTMHKYITKDPSEFIKYHEDRIEVMKNWPEIPYEVIAKHIKNKKNIVADFGCGKNLMKECIENKVYGFDHYAVEESVIACNMKHIPVEDEFFDVAVFSLSLWGTKNDIDDYFKEAYRVLNFGGQLYIAEPSKKYTNEDRTKLIEQLNEIGFEIIGNIDDHGTFFYLNMIKK